MTTILSIKAREVLDSRGNPTVEAEIKTTDGTFRGIVPSGASTGTYEAHELRDNEKRYLGKGVGKAVNNINKFISEKLKNVEVTDQRTIDEIMVKMDGTENKSKLGANSILAVSIAACKAGAASEEMHLYEYIARLSGNKNFSMPVPMVLCMEGGKHADNASDIQEFMIMPVSADSFREALRISTEIYHNIGKILKGRGMSINVGFEGAYPASMNTENVIEIIIDGIKISGYQPEYEILISLDSAATEFFSNGEYRIDEKPLIKNEIVDFYSKLVENYPIISLEDPLAEDDWLNWQKLTAEIGNKIQIVGDDLTVTNKTRLQKAIDMKAINSILIKINQIGTITETLDVINIADKNNISSVISHRSGETEDTFIADLVVATAKQCKFGAPARGERTAKYNQLLRLEEITNAKYAGKNALSVVR